MPLAFIPPGVINFSLRESQQTGKIVRGDNTGFSQAVHRYRFNATDTSLIDFAMVEYYETELYCVRLISRHKSRVDSLSRQIEIFYGKPFNRNQCIQRRDISICRHSQNTSEYYTEFVITNRTVQSPSICRVGFWRNVGYAFGL